METILSIWPEDAALVEVAADLMQIATGFAAVAIAFIVFRHNRRTDKETLRERAWAAQQELNFIALANPDVMKAAEFTINGSLEEKLSDEDLLRAVYTTFVQINRIHLLWNGYKSGIFRKSEVEDEIRPTLTLISGNRELFDYCLSRGYSKEFRAFAMREADSITGAYIKPEEGSSFLKKLRSKISPQQKA